MSNPAFVPASLPGSYGVCIAFSDSLYSTSPTWTRLDDPTAPVWGFKVAAPHHANCVSNWSIDRGRTYELDKTQSGTATITLMDPNGLFDPTNASSPFYLKVVPMLRAKISMQNPSSGLYYDMFTGWVESWNWTMTTEENLMTVTVHLVDGFELLTRAEIPPDTTGTTTLAATSDVSTRIVTLLNLANWPVDPGDGLWRVLNSGNVFLQQTIYNPQTQILSAIQDAADAEFPGVANFFIGKGGTATFYGRYTRFHPTNYPTEVNFWVVGDEGGASSQGGARIQDIAWQLDSKNLINAALSYQNQIPISQLPGQLYTNSTSIAKYGVRTYSLPDLINNGQPSPGAPPESQPAADPATSCWFYAKYYVDNYSDPQLRISNLSFSSRPISDNHTWDLLTGVEIGDIITVYTNDPGGGGFGKQTDLTPIHQFFVEGIHYSTNPLTANYPDVVMTLDVSPRTWFNEAPWALAYITLSPASAKAGATVTISGVGFTASSTITTHTWDGGALTLSPATPAVSGGGTWSATFTVPASGTAPGQQGHQVLVADATGLTVTRFFGVSP